MRQSPPREPTAGVDIELRRQLWTRVRELNSGGTTIVLTTHYLEEAEQLCDQIAIIHRGRVVAADTTVALVQRLDHKELTLALAEAPTEIPAPLAGYEVELTPFRQLRIRYQPSRTQIAEILAAVQAAGLTILDMTTEESDLEDIFLALTGDAAETDAEAPPSA